MLEIKTLGNFTINKDGEALDLPISTRGKVLLVYLVLEGGTHHRNTLAALFWPDSSESKANTSLRVVLTELRKNVGEYLEINRTSVGLLPDRDLYIDVFDFEELLAEGNLRQALQIYRGDFLSGIYITGSTEYENWRRWESERIRLLAVRNLENAVIREMGLENYQKTEHYARGLLKLDPTNTIANQNYIIALALDNHSSDAIIHLKEYQSLLKEELGLDLPPGISQIKEIIKTGDNKSLLAMIIPTHNLPDAQTSFIGRESDIAAISDLIVNQDSRLINLVGPGGIGKTRLAIRAIRANLMKFSDGAYLVPLEDLKSGDQIIPAIARALQFKYGTIVTLLDPQTQLIDYIKTRELAIILDGIEHLTTAGQIISTLLMEAPNLHIIVTSRHKLNLTGEWVHQVNGLPYLGAEESDELPDALALFLARRRQHNSDSFSKKELEEASQICSVLEGLPLGIELAAAWTPVLSSSEIVNKIQENYGALEDRNRDAADKHLSLRVVFNSSWDLLDYSLKETLLKLSVFRGGFSYQAAKDVCDTSLANLSSLIDKSLLHKDSQGRFDIHPMVRQFCQEILVRENRAGLETILNHYRYYAKFISDRMPGIYDLNPNHARSEIQANLKNILAAVEFVVLHPESAPNLVLIQDLFSFYLIQGWHDGGLAFQNLASLMEYRNDVSTKDNSLLLAMIQAQRGFFYSNLGLVEESEEICQKSLPVLEQENQTRELAILLNNLGVNAIFRGEYENAFYLLEKAVQVSQYGKCSSFPSFHLWIGYLYFLLAKYKKGLASLQTSLELFSKDNNHWGKAFAYSKMGLATDGLGQHSEAMKLHQQSLDIFRITDDHTGQGYALSRMSLGALLQKDFQTAFQYGEQGLVHFTESGHRWGICASLSRIAYAKLGLEKTQDAQDLFIEALKLGQASKLELLCLHAMAGIAATELVAGHKSKARDLIRYVNNHPKTPPIYMELSWIWFRKFKNSHLKMAADQEIMDLDLEIKKILTELA